MTETELRLSSGRAEAVFDLQHGGRLATLRVGGMDVLVDSDEHAMRWGSYPMAPWAGRVRHGRFRFAGVDHQLPITIERHAIHGTAYSSQWHMDDGEMALKLGPPWPFPARLSQAAELNDDGLRITMRLQAEVDQPAILGWHPWFRRHLHDDDAAHELELLFEPGSMFEMGQEMIPTGRLVSPTAPPWDNCFADLAAPPLLRWPGRLEISLHSDCAYWTVFTEPTHAICVEPQTDAPDAFNRNPYVIAAGDTLSASFELRWRLL